MPRIFRASHNEDQFDSLKLVGECGRYLLSYRCLISAFCMCIDYQRSGTANTSSYLTDLCIELGLLFLSIRLSAKGVSMCVSDDRLLSEFQVWRH